MDKKYNHVEAFSFMTYAPEEGNMTLPFKRIYKIWNSRDGVTPFNYPINGEMCNHINWHHDVCMPDYILKVGDMYWRDKTEEEAKAEAIRRMKHFEGSKYEVKETDESYPELIKSIIEDCLQIPVLDIFK